MLMYCHTSRLRSTSTVLMRRMRIEQRGHAVVMLDLRGELLAMQAEHVARELVGQPHPVQLRISDVMRVEVARGPTELAAERHGAQQLQLFIHPLHEDL